MDGAGDSVHLCPLIQSRISLLFQPTTAYHFREKQINIFLGQPEAGTALVHLFCSMGNCRIPRAGEKKERKRHCALPACGASTPLGRKSEKKGSLVQVGAFHVSQSGLPPPHPNPRFMGESSICKKKEKDAYEYMDVRYSQSSA